MFGKRVTLFKLFGFSVRIDISWLVIALLIVWSLSTGVFPHYYEGLSSATYWIMGIIGAVGLFVSIIVHEFSHSLIARRFGLPMEGITLFIFGGVAEMDEEPPSAKAEFFMAIAGPITSIIIGLCAYLAFRLGTAAQWPVPAYGVIGYLALINLLLAGFNLVPAFPLDGGRVLRSALWAWKKDLQRATRIASGFGKGFGFLLIAMGILSIFQGGVVGGLWWVLIGMFIQNASDVSYRRLLSRRMLQGYPIERFIKQNPVTVTPSLSIKSLIEDYIYKYHYKLFPVTDNGNLLGCITTNEVKNVPREKWETTTVDDVAHTCSPDNTISRNTDAIHALSRMHKTGKSRFVVVDENNTLAGVLTTKDLLDFLSLKIEFDEGSGRKMINKKV